MHADWSVELGREDEALEFPWSSQCVSPDQDAPRYYDLKRHPELMVSVPEAYHPVEMGEFLSSINSSSSLFESVKCDLWFTEELSEEEQIFGAACKAASYVDVIFTEPQQRFEREAHERLAERMCKLLSLVPEISAAAEFGLRRCYFHHNGDASADSDPGFYVTIYVSGYGDDSAEAWQRWGIALKLVENALLQVSAQARAANPAAK
jgi:hypothetical protein